MTNFCRDKFLQSLSNLTRLFCKAHKNDSCSALASDKATRGEGGTYKTVATRQTVARQAVSGERNVEVVAARPDVAADPLLRVDLEVVLLLAVFTRRSRDEASINDVER